MNEYYDRMIKAERLLEKIYTYLSFPETETEELIRDITKEYAGFPCSGCGGEVGHRINCPDGIAFSDRKYISENSADEITF